jgi:hypothetical protein
VVTVEPSQFRGASTPPLLQADRGGKETISVRCTVPGSGSFQSVAAQATRHRYGTLPRVVGGSGPRSQLYAAGSSPTTQVGVVRHSRRTATTCPAGSPRSAPLLLPQRCVAGTAGRTRRARRYQQFNSAATKGLEFGDISSSEGVAWLSGEALCILRRDREGGISTAEITTEDDRPPACRTTSAPRTALRDCRNTDEEFGWATAATGHHVGA